MRTERRSRAKVTPFPRSPANVANGTEVENQMRNVRKKADLVTDMLSAARFAADQCRDVIARGFALLDRIEALGFEMRAAERGYERRGHRLFWEIRMTIAVQGMIL